MRRLLFYLLPLVVLATACQGDTDGTRLFTITYPVTEPIILAGASTFTTFVVPQEDLATGFQQALADNGVTAEDVDLVGGFRCRLTSLTGDDFRDIERVELRVCEQGRQFGCNEILHIAFSQADLFNRRQQVINLSPSLRNFRELFLGSERFRAELVIFPGTTVSRTLETRLEWSLQAVGDLE